MRVESIMSEILDLPSGYVELPAFFPDGTSGVVRSLDKTDLLGANIQGIVMNTLHLMRKPGVSVIKELGGLHRFASWDRVILTDSGGFQVFSMLRENSKYGTINEKGIIFRPSPGEKIELTPERCIQVQYLCGSDIFMSLDYCTHPDDPYQTNKESVEITIGWALRCKKEYERLLETYSGDKRPLIFGIIQGGKDRELRKICADSLIEIGFDGYGFGGWPVDKDGNLLIDILEYTASLMPDNLPKYAMGIGKPENIVICADLGYNLFDCVIPTREARHGKLYVFNPETDLKEKKFYSNIFIREERYTRDERPISEDCKCYTCRNFSRGYLHHLFELEDCLAFRLATIHNLYFYSELMRLIKEKRYA